MAQRLRGKSVPLNAGRKLVNELMRQSQHVPLIILRRDFKIPAILAARDECEPRISWIAIFIKAYALAACKHIHLRHNWLSFPFGRIYEHPVSEAVIPIEREWQGDSIVLGAKIRAPESMTLELLDDHLRRFRRDTVRSISPFRQALRLAKMPSLLRRFLFWSSLHVSGVKRCKRFGTFIVSSLGQHGCELVGPRVPLTGYLTFGPIDDDGRVSICFSFDHRAMDGLQAARALEDMEKILNTVLAQELRAMIPHSLSMAVSGLSPA